MAEPDSYEELRQLKDEYRYDFKTEVDYFYKAPPGLNEDIVREMSAIKG